MTLAELSEPTSRAEDFKSNFYWIGLLLIGLVCPVIGYERIRYRINRARTINLDHLEPSILITCG